MGICESYRELEVVGVCESGAHATWKMLKKRIEQVINIFIVTSLTNSLGVLYKRVFNSSSNLGYNVFSVTKTIFSRPCQVDLRGRKQALILPLFMFTYSSLLSLR